MIVFSVKGDIPELSCHNGTFVVKNHSIVCLLCLVCPEGMGPSVECIGGVLYEEDLEYECILCPTGYYSDIHGTNSCVKCKICSEYKKIRKPEHDSVCVDSIQRIMAKSIFVKDIGTKTSKTIKLNNVFIALVVCFTTLHVLLFICHCFFIKLVQYYVFSSNVFHKN